jgi:hypothetical protein
LLEELGFVTHPRDVPDVAEEHEDPTCLAELMEDIEKSRNILRLLLKKSTGGKAGAPAISVATDLQQVVDDCFPDEFVVCDACLTNAEFVWFHKHFYS